VRNPDLLVNKQIFHESGKNNMKIIFLGSSIHTRGANISFRSQNCRIWWYHCAYCARDMLGSRLYIPIGAYEW